ncbi:MAG: tyrosine-type recombinase/integrase [Flavobacterium sp.]|nr:tyrosine-type recombinase/integrase [Flavobacterium sp.]
MRNNLDAFRAYLQMEKHYSPHTVGAYLKDISSFERFIVADCPDNTLEQVDYGLVRAWIVSLVDSGIGNSSINRKISSLKSFYKFLLKIKQIEVSPLLKHKALKTPKKLQIPFSEKEVDDVLKLITYPEGFDGMRDKLIIDLFYTTGIRRTELIHLLKRDVDLSSNSLKVLGKRNKERILPVLPVISDQIKLYSAERDRLGLSGGEFLFVTNRGVKLNDSLVYRLINTYFSNVSEKIKKSPHILRHTFATHLLNNGADLNSVKELLGHSSLASTQVYTHSSLSELKKVYSGAHPRNK